MLEFLFHWFQLRVAVVWNSSSIQPNATTINGYLDFWSTVSGEYVTAHWKVTITTPKTYVTHVNLSILWSSGGTEAFHSFNYSTYNNPTYVANEAENAYYIGGSHKAQIQGSVSTTQGEAYTIEPTPEYGTIYFVTN